MKKDREDGPAISAADIEAYERDGVICLRSAFPSDWIARLQVGVEEAIAGPGPQAEVHGEAASGLFIEDFYMWKRLDIFRRFVFDSPAAKIAARIMGSGRINFFYDQLLVKEPGSGSRTPWHQDQPYWAVEGRQVCSIWLALDPVAAESSVRYVRGSHRWGTRFNPTHFADGTPYRDTGLPALPDIDADPGAYDIVSWDMRPGDCLVFQAMIVHGAPGNASPVTRRRALATRWTGDDARFAKRTGEVAVPHWDPGLADGDPLDCPDFPRIWTDGRKQPQGLTVGP